MPDDDRALEFLFFMSFFYPLLAWAVFPMAPAFIFRERAFGIVLPYLYILLARFVAPRNNSMLFPKYDWMPTIPSLIFGTFLFCGAAHTLQEGLWPTDVNKRAQSDCRALIREKGLGNAQWLRGDTVLDGVALVEVSKHDNERHFPGFFILSSRPLERWQPRFETLSYIGIRDIPLRHLRPLLRKGSVILYGLS